MMLSSNQADNIGASDEALQRAGLTRVKRSSTDYFSCRTYTASFDRAYERNLDMIPKVREVTGRTIQKYSDGNGFFPTFASHQAILSFATTKHLDTWIEVIKKDFGEQLLLEINDEVLTINNAEPNTTIIEFDFMPHNNGVYISILSHLI